MPHVENESILVRPDGVYRVNNRGSESANGKGYRVLRRIGKPIFFEDQKIFAISGLDLADGTVVNVELGGRLEEAVVYDADKNASYLRIRKWMEQQKD